MFGACREHLVTPDHSDLASISRLYYGTSAYALTIFQHNLDVLTDPNDVPLGTRLVIPHVTPL